MKKVLIIFLALASMVSQDSLGEGGMPMPMPPPVGGPVPIGPSPVRPFAPGVGTHTYISVRTTYRAYPAPYRGAYGYGYGGGYGHGFPGYGGYGYGAYGHSRCGHRRCCYRRRCGARGFRLFVGVGRGFVGVSVATRRVGVNVGVRF